MKIPSAIVAFCTSIFLAIVACDGCTEIGSGQTTHLVGEYYLESSVESMYLCKGQSPGCGAIVGDVRDVDWNNEFIVTKDWQLLEAGKTETGKYVWHIVNVNTGQLCGPFSFDEYVLERSTLSVPDALALLRPQEEDYVVIRRKLNKP